MKSKINQEVREIWNTNATYWDSRMGEGNDFHRILLEPNQLDLLDIKKGDLILDIACGAGQFARKMTETGARVTAIDFSDEQIRIARTKPLADKIDYRVIDVCDEDDLATLSRYQFDAAVCTMAIMDIENIEPLIKFLPGVLRPGGKFVFSILHPSFNSGDTTLVQEHSDIPGKRHHSYYVKVSDYLISRKYKGVGMRGQPKNQYYFHRPLSEILNLCFENGFYMYGIREPGFGNRASDSIYGNTFRNNPAAVICGLVLKQ